jgi:hypothetical protein
MMIPTMILFGLIFGRWWRSTLVVGTIGWAVLLMSEGIVQSAQEIAEAAALGFANTLVGVAVHQGVLRLVRNIRKSRSGPAQHHA